MSYYNPEENKNIEHKKLKLILKFKNVNDLREFEKLFDISLKNTKKINYKIFNSQLEFE